MGPEILLQPFLEQTISQDCQLFAKYSFTQWPRLCKRIFWENPPLTPPKLISGTRLPRRWRRQCLLLKSIMNHRELYKKWHTKRKHPAPVLRWAGAATCGLVPRLPCLWPQGHWLSPQRRREEAEGRVSIGPAPPSNSPQAGCLHPWRALTSPLWSPGSRSAPPSLAPQTCDNTAAIISPGHCSSSCGLFCILPTSMQMATLLNSSQSAQTRGGHLFLDVPRPCPDPSPLN